MNTNTLILIGTYVIIAGVLASMPARTKKTMAEAGELKLAVKNKVKISFIAIFAAAILLPLVVIFRDYSLLYNIMFCLISVMGSVITARDACLMGHYGVYVNCVIAGGICVRYDDIVTFPVLNLPLEEQENYDHANLVIATKSKGNLNMVFASEEECKKATDLVRGLSGK